MINDINLVRLLFSSKIEKPKKYIILLLIIFFIFGSIITSFSLYEVAIVNDKMMESNDIIISGTTSSLDAYSHVFNSSHSNFKEISQELRIRSINTNLSSNINISESFFQTEFNIVSVKKPYLNSSKFAILDYSDEPSDSSELSISIPNKNLTRTHSFEDHLIIQNLFHILSITNLDFRPFIIINQDNYDQIVNSSDTHYFSFSIEMDQNANSFSEEKLLISKYSDFLSDKLQSLDNLSFSLVAPSEERLDKAELLFNYSLYSIITIAILISLVLLIVADLSLKSNFDNFKHFKELMVIRGETPLRASFQYFKISLVYSLWMILPLLISFSLRIIFSDLSSLYSSNFIVAAILFVISVIHPIFYVFKKLNHNNIEVTEFLYLIFIFTGLYLVDVDNFGVLGSILILLGAVPVFQKISNIILLRISSSQFALPSIQDSILQKMANLKSQNYLEKSQTSFRFLLLLLLILISVHSNTMHQSLQYDHDLGSDLGLRYSPNLDFNVLEDKFSDLFTYTNYSISSMRINDLNFRDYNLELIIIDIDQLIDVVSYNSNFDFSQLSEIKENQAIYLDELANFEDSKNDANYLIQSSTGYFNVNSSQVLFESIYIPGVNLLFEDNPIAIIDLNYYQSIVNSSNSENLQTYYSVINKMVESDDSEVIEYLNDINANYFKINDDYTVLNIFFKRNPGLDDLILVISFILTLMAFTSILIHMSSLNYQIYRKKDQTLIERGLHENDSRFDFNNLLFMILIFQVISLLLIYIASLVFILLINFNFKMLKAFFNLDLLFLLLIVISSVGYRFIRKYSLFKSIFPI